MQKAQNSLANAQNNAPAQQAAIDALKKAEQQLAQDIAQLEKAQQDLAALEALLEELKKVIEGQQNVESKTADEAAKPNDKPLKELSSQQNELGDKTSGLEQKAASPAPAAARRARSAADARGRARRRGR